MKGLNWRVVTVVFTILFAVYLLTPSIVRYTTLRSIGKIAKADDPWYFKFFPSEALKLGLDLVGGLHLVIGIDFDEVHRDSVVKMKNQLKEQSEQEKIEGVTFEATSDNFIVVKFPDEAQWKKVDAIIAKDLGQLLDFVSQDKTSAKLRLSSLYEAEVRRRAIDQSMETLRNRIDEFGIAEPVLQRQGEEKILVQFPGVQDTGRLKDIIARTAKLSFQIVKTGPEEPVGPIKEEQLKDWFAQFQKEKNTRPDDPTRPISLFLKDLNAWLKGKIPEGTEVLFSKKTNVNTRENEYTPYLLDREALVTGEDLQDAYYSFNENNEPIVNFQLTPMGATKFEKATGENVHKYMAIVLDSNVHSAPRIKQKIGGGRAMIEMGTQGRSQSDIVNDAKDTSLVLRSGALPARLMFLEERTIGPSLGADSIRRGTNALAIGVCLVFGFLILYYRAAGSIAVGALALNGLFILAVMSAFEGTLTLPGLAGLTLSLGMSVDANVLIFEHIREELRKGKSLNMAIAEGYSHAFSAIFDANVTTVLAGVVLLSFGYGAIRGFAVTLLIGVIISQYTAVFVTRVVFDQFVVSRHRKSISL